jgi:hypothetical protein
MSALKVAKPVVLQDSSIWDCMQDLYCGDRSQDFRSVVDFRARALCCAPFPGEYGVAGWTLAVQGAPPRGLIFFTSAAMVYVKPGECRALEPGKLYSVLKRFRERYLSAAICRWSGGKRCR